jgi:molybdopterin-guanine dinucleotide biosynthesis protein A
LKIAGVVLAGGMSSRMGQDKANLLLDKETLLARSVALLSSLALTNVFVSGDYQRFQSIPDIQTSLGPIGGLHACVETLFSEYNALFVIPVDMPLLGIDECLDLLKQFKQHPQGVYYEQVSFPMILPLTEQLKKYLTEVLTSQNNKQRSLYRLIKTVKLQAVKYKIENNFRFKNSNTPEQWADCLKTYRALKQIKD